MLESETFSPIAYFLEPVLATLNYVALRYAHGASGMTGYSGGGWTTTLYAAIDERISRSYPVADTLPIDLREPRDWGDYEQTLPALYRIATYPELYILGSFGEGRGQLQVLNKYDPCCFAGERHRGYEKAVQSRLALLGSGSFAVLLDDTHDKHEISLYALQHILDDFERARAS